ncbi:ribonucleotide-diphosphate reductase subunit alpha (plasmid) [Salmonella enterica]|nr:ribonucleotide-diphosphate reductase subunit alpha [Salmonella enterica]
MDENIVTMVIQLKTLAHSKETTLAHP